MPSINCWLTKGGDIDYSIMAILIGASQQEKIRIKPTSFFFLMILGVSSQPSHFWVSIHWCPVSIHPKWTSGNLNKMLSRPKQTFLFGNSTHSNFLYYQQSFCIFMKPSSFIKCLQIRLFTLKILHVVYYTHNRKDNGQKKGETWENCACLSASEL